MPDTPGLFRAGVHPTRPPEALGALDGLRGIAALIVIGSHASQQGLSLMPGLDLAGTGKSGVYLFFVISAYLLTRQWLASLMAADEAARRPYAPLARYLLRRTARIFPLYALVLLAAWWLHPRSLGVSIDDQALWRHLMLLEGRDLYWSVPVEFKYYLLIPPFAWLLARPVKSGWKVAGTVMLIAALAWVYPPGAAPQNSVELGYYLPVFLCGSVAAAWAIGQQARQPVPSSRGHLEPPVTRGRWLDVLVFAMFLASVPALARLVSPGVAPDFSHQAFLPWGVFWSSVLSGLVAGRLPVWQRVCLWPPLRACGRWCFGLYLLHLPALVLARKLPVHETLQAWVGLFLSVLVAALAYRLVEQPAMQWAQRLGAPSRR